MKPLFAAALRPASRKFALAATTGLLILAGCARSNTPTQYGALTETNFTEGCTSSGSSARYCTCTYGVLSGPDGIPFSEFAKLNDQLAKNPDAMPDDVKARVQTCGTPGGPTTLAPAPTDTTAP